MIAALREFTDRLLGRGEASISVPVFDGALKSNTLIEDAEVVAQLEAPRDLATDGQAVFASDGARVLRLDASGQPGALPGEALRFERPVSALACLPGGGFAVGIEGRELLLRGGAHDGKRIDSAGGKPFVALNAIAAGSNGKLLVTDGSAQHGPDLWKHDLMTLGRSGRLCEVDPASGGTRELAAGLAYAFGAGMQGDAAWVSESWKHRVLAIRAGQAPAEVVESLPGYPSRMSPARGGGWWLTCFVLRTQLVEFVLREPEFRRRMVAEIDPDYWVAPALSSNNTFLEPMQGAHLKVMGIVKPWAPPRSYGLVIRLTDTGLIRYSLHSRFDGRNHGVSAVVECGGYLYMLALGNRRVLRVPIADVERSFGA